MFFVRQPDNFLEAAYVEIYLALFVRPEEDERDVRALAFLRYGF